MSLGVLPRDVAFSFALHGAVIGAALLALPQQPNLLMPLIYRVDLVQPAEKAQPRPPAPPPPQRRPAAPEKTQAPPRHKPEAKPLPRAEPEKKPEARSQTQPNEQVRTPPQKVQEASPPQTAATGPVRLEGDVRISDPYLQQIVTRIHRQWRDIGGSGARRCVVYFSILRSGQIESPRLETPSGSPAFDRAALSAVRRVGRFQPLPPSVRDRQLGVHFEFAQEE